MDTTPPLITITGGQTVYHNPGAPYTDQGATVNDSIDGGLGAQEWSGEHLQVGEYTITYTAADSSGNGAAVQRTVIVRESDAPVMVLQGDAQMDHEAGTPFVDPGASAEDALMEPLLWWWKEVDVQSPGTHVLSYTATDSSGNQSEPILRAVKVVDTVGPVVSLVGDALMTHQAATMRDPERAQWSAYQGERRTRTAVDPETPGTYTLTYVSEDDSNKPAP